MQIRGSVSGTTYHDYDAPSSVDVTDDEGNAVQQNSDSKGDTTPATTDYKYGSPTKTDGTGDAITIDSADADSGKGHKRHGRIHLHYMVKT
jgi:hypothetical protein